ncbi:MAG: ATP-binding protein [Candidatus Delongbacteria bacterium]|nr:ATP-binding protein [Candidatus Delongbacteria bacterium]
MKEIVVISGKGGTGKTSVALSLACTGPEKIVLADCDVDASDLHLILKPKKISEDDFYSSDLAVIDYDRCTDCGKCSEVCRFSAIGNRDNKYYIDGLNCEGCGYCGHVCPVKAISMVKQKDGVLTVSDTRLGKRLFHAELGPGAENSGKLVAKVKNTAKKSVRENEYDYLLVDGSPGIGCPVISSLSGADLVVLVTETTLSGFSDLKRVVELVKKFRIRMGCVINKSDINDEICGDIRQYLQSENIELMSEIPYTEDFPRAISEGLSPAEYSVDLKKEFERIWNKIINLTGDNK